VINNLELLRRLYAVGAAGSWEDAQLAADTLSYISALEHSVPEPSRDVSFSQLVLMLGHAYRALADERNRVHLKTAARQCGRLPFHLFALRGQLTDILDAVEMEVAR